MCDLAELPRRHTDAIGLQVWADDTGAPVPVATLRVQSGPVHCDWQSMTFLELDGATYVRDPLPDLRAFVRGPFREHVAVPDDAVATAYEHDGDRLWTSPDGRRVLVGTPDDAEAWPRASDDLVCS
ncbi:MAG: hypothetical protein Q7T56_14610 [Nocardioidaceae bacterium]|nr:hypothetical protein [Nocardioidaceae bacterium]